jgi:hypothetical protein
VEPQTKDPNRLAVLTRRRMMPRIARRRWWRWTPQMPKIQMPKFLACSNDVLPEWLFGLNDLSVRKYLSNRLLL